MKSVATMVALAITMVAGTVFADFPAAANGGNGAKAEAAPAKKHKPNPKKPYYTKLKPARLAAADWEQPILLFLLKKNDDDSNNLKRKVLNRKDLKTFFTTNCVVMQVEIPTDRKGVADPKLLGKDEAKLYEDAKDALRSIELPATIILDVKGAPKAQVGKYVLDVGAGPWLSMLDAALKTAGYGGAKMTKEAEKIIADNKPDGKSKVQKDNKR